MKTRWLINLGLMIALVASVMVMRNEIERERFVPVLTDLVAEDVYQIQIDRKGEAIIVLSQDLRGWRMLEPMQVDADQERIEKLLGILSTPVQRSFPEQAAALDELGLAPAKLELRVDSATLRFGDIDPLGQSRYVASNGLVHLISDRFYPLLISPPIDYVSPKLLPRDFDPVFGRLGGIPLATDSLGALDEVIAERVEPLAKELSGSATELERDDGTRLRFIVSEDRRRWARLDQRLLYVLTDAPEIAFDRDAVDPAPPETATSPTDAPPSSIASEPAEGASETSPPFDGIREELPANPNAPVPVERVPYDGSSTTGDLVPDSGASMSTPPVVKLTPDGREIPISPGPASQAPILPMDDQSNPYGFGVDPFAPDPPSGAVQGPEESP